MAIRNTLVCQVVGYDERQEQVPARQQGIAARHALSRRSGRRSPLPASEPRKPILLGQGTDSGRKPRSQPEHEPQPCGRPVGHPDGKPQSAGQLHPCAEQADSPNGTLRTEDGSHCPRNYPCQRHQPVGRTVVDAGAHQAYSGEDRQAEPGGSVAQSGSLLPRRRSLHALPRAIQGGDTQQQDALRRDLQCFRRLLRRTRASVASKRWN